MEKFGTAVILAGGKSQRMDYDKQFLTVNNENVIQKNIEILKELFPHIIIITNESAHHKYENVTCCSDIFENCGPLGGIHAGLKKSKSKFAYFVACDMPVINIDYIKMLINQKTTDITMAIITKAENKIQPFQGFYSIDCIEKIENDLNNNKNSIYKFIENLQNDVIYTVYENNNIFININTKQDLENFQNSNLRKFIEIKKNINGDEKIIQDFVICEFDFEIIINGKSFIILMCTQKNLKELAVGFLFSQGIINQYKDILHMKIKNGKCYIKTKENETFTYKNDGDIIGKRVITTGCGRQVGVNYPLSALKTMSKIEGNSNIFTPKVVLNLISEFNKGSELFKETGSTHSCAIATTTQIITTFDDVGRHNALDKIIGYVLINHINIQDKILLTTGRISSEMASKVINAKIPTLASRSAPTDLAINLAQKHGLTLMGFARGSRINIYC